MNITIERIIPIEKAFAAIKNAQLLETTGNKQIYFYKNAELRLADFHPEELNPVALYLLRDNLDFQRKLRSHLLDRYNIDTLQLSSVLHLKTDGGIVGLIPPYVEISEENLRIIPKEGDRLPPDKQTARIPLLIDGMHRAWIAREENKTIKCVLVRNTPSDYLYTSYPVE